MKMDFFRNRIAAFFITGSLLIGGCDMFLDDEPTCEEKITAYYDLGCYFVTDGEASNLYDAIDGCEEMLYEMQAIKCEKYIYNWFKCSDELTSDNCGGCSYHLDEMNACIEDYYYYSSDSYGK
ncbi:MAG: hypothetical protein JXX29_14470 [Deltaproteobacteria bacterium]|nr:hypothetical protein [Deltaproteobacteria bacterium]MBN2672884.1 hypothetical protein [Deltaproteobacteria bacterium]